MIQYSLECITFQLVFLLIYDLFLKRETFFQWNRVYLLGTYCLSLLLPLIQLKALRTTLSQEYVFSSNLLMNLEEFTITPNSKDRILPEFSWYTGLLLIGMFISLLLLGFKLWQINKLRRNGQVAYFTNFTRIIVANSTIAFSFFKSIFIGDKVSQKEYENIVQHELVHIQQGHSWDLLFFELMRIIGWFNPLVYIYQRRTSELHEFIADAQAAKTNKKEQYQLLLSQVFQTENISFINPFFKSSLIKKRIVMLQKTKSKKVWQLKYLVLLPLVVGMLFYSSCEQESESDNRMIVRDAENLSIEEEKELFKELIKLSESEGYWEFTITDKTSSIFFSKTEDGSFISGPNGEKIWAKMTINSSKSDFSFSQDLVAIPFGLVDKVPVFPGCEDAMDTKACFLKSIQEHIAKNFNYPQEARDSGLEGRVNTMFIITSDGTIRDIRVKGPHKILEDEVERIMKRLPLMVPGESNGQPVSVPFSMPVTFQLN